MTPSSLRVVLAVTISAVVAAVVVIGLLVIGVPGEARLRRLDERRVEHLQQLPALLGEVVLATKELNLKARSAAYELLVQLCVQS